MKLFTEKGIVQKIIIAVIIVTLLNFMIPTVSSAFDVGGLLFEPITDLVTTIGDSILSALQREDNEYREKPSVSALRDFRYWLYRSRQDCYELRFEQNINRACGSGVGLHTYECRERRAYLYGKAQVYQRVSKAAEYT